MKKIILVTGGTRGLGRATAIHLNKLGYEIIVDYKERDDKAEELKEMGINTFKADITKRENIKKLVDYVINKYVKIDCLVNNAGIDSEGLFQDISDEEYKRVMDGNFYSLFATSQEVVSHMIKNGGSIINIASVYGVNGGSYASIYSASKGAIIALTKSLAKELAPSKIRVNSISPGAMNTDMTKGLSEEGWRLWLDRTPLNKKGEGIDIARCIAWLIEDEFTTGQNIIVDGGYTL